MELPKELNLGKNCVYRLVLFRIESRYDNGIPETLTLLPEEGMIELSPQGGDQFMTAYVLVTMLNPNEEDQNNQSQC